jgi:hypothetical protein
MVPTQRAKSQAALAGYLALALRASRGLPLWWEPQGWRGPEGILAGTWGRVIYLGEPLDLDRPLSAPGYPPVAYRRVRYPLGPQGYPRGPIAYPPQGSAGGRLSDLSVFFYTGQWVLSGVSLSACGPALSAHPPLALPCQLLSGLPAQTHPGSVIGRKNVCCLPCFLRVAWHTWGVDVRQLGGNGRQLGGKTDREGSMGRRERIILTILAYLTLL